MALSLLLPLVVLAGAVVLTAWHVRGKRREVDAGQPTSIEDAARRAGL
jgi:hypothetical protein